MLTLDSTNTNTELLNCNNNFDEIKPESLRFRSATQRIVSEQKFPLRFKPSNLMSVVDVSGECYLTTSNAKKLFTLGKEWIQQRWRKKLRGITHMEIVEKVIGRNEGFVIVVTVLNPREDIKYFAKIQTPHIETVITHHLLNCTTCGPDEFFIAVLNQTFRYGWYYVHELGVITQEVSNWKMASSWSDTERLLLSKNSALEKDSFLLTFMILLGQFGNIPNNRDNWGLINTSNVANASVAAPSMKLVDFYTQASFLARWYVVHDECFAYREKDHSYDALESWLKQTRIEDQVSYFPWLQSQTALVTMLQKVCDRTEAWLQSVIFDPDENLCPTSATTAVWGQESSTEPPLLQAFKNHTQLETSHCNSTVRAMVCEYVSWVEGWNTQIQALCKWFPFPEDANDTK